MKKALAFTALSGLALLPVGARAEMNLSLGGYFSGYGVWADNNEVPTVFSAVDSWRQFDLRRDTEVHVSGETTLDNGLTIGFHTEQALGGATLTDEVYAYVSGSWGRINLGSEDGAAYLLQVAAPSADSNIDGLRTYVQAFAPAENQTRFYKYSNTAGAAASRPINFSDIDAGFGGGATLDYDHVSGGLNAATDRFTYLSPKWNGFQIGASYAPEEGQNQVGDAVASPGNTDQSPTYVDNGGVVNVVGIGSTQHDNVWEASARWDGAFQGIGVSAGVGYSTSDLAGTKPLTATVGDTGTFTVTDGADTWNGGLSFSWNNFSLGGSYLATSVDVAAVTTEGAGNYFIRSGQVERETWVGGLAWGSGPYHLGVSYLNQQTNTPTLGASQANATDIYFTGNENSVDKVTIGGGYLFGPGMSLRGSVAFGEYVTGGEFYTAGPGTGIEAADNRFTQVAVGTQIQF